MPFHSYRRFPMQCSVTYNAGPFRGRTVPGDTVTSETGGHSIETQENTWGQRSAMS
jgi:hypothetical protein